MSASRVSDRGPWLVPQMPLPSGHEVRNSFASQLPSMRRLTSAASARQAVSGMSSPIHSESSTHWLRYGPYRSSIEVSCHPRARRAPRVVPRSLAERDWPLLRRIGGLRRVAPGGEQGSGRTSRPSTDLSSLPGPRCWFILPSWSPMRQPSPGPRRIRRMNPEGTWPRWRALTCWGDSSRSVMGAAIRAVITRSWWC